MNEKTVSISVIRRLPRYYRYLGMLLHSGVTRISSKELAAQMKVTASQIRQDLNCFCLLYTSRKPDDDKEEDAGILAYVKDDDAVSADFRCRKACVSLSSKGKIPCPDPRGWTGEFFYSSVSSVESDSSGSVPSPSARR